jgi:hypothetical protein
LLLMALDEADIIPDELKSLEFAHNAGGNPLIIFLEEPFQVKI